MKDALLLIDAARIWKKLAEPQIAVDLDLNKYSLELMKLLKDVDEKADPEGATFATIATLQEALDTATRQLSSIEYLIARQEHDFVGFG